mgnify:CR=1 FL=1
MSPRTADGSAYLSTSPSTSHTLSTQQHSTQHSCSPALTHGLGAATAAPHREVGSLPLATRRTPGAPPQPTLGCGLSKVPLHERTLARLLPEGGLLRQLCGPLRLGSPSTDRKQRLVPLHGLLLRTPASGSEPIYQRIEQLLHGLRLVRVHLTLEPSYSESVGAGCTTRRRGDRAG